MSEPKKEINWVSRLVVGAAVIGFILLLMFLAGIFKTKCGSHGTLLLDDTCKCNTGYTGETCENKA